MNRKRSVLLSITAIAVGCWGLLLADLRGRQMKRSLLELEPRLTASDKVVYRDEWMGVYIGDNKVGWKNFTLARGDRVTGEQYVVQSRTNLVFSVFGTPQPLVIQTTASLNRDLIPTAFKTIMVTAEQRITILGNIEEDRITVRLSDRHGEHTLAIPITAPQTRQLVLEETLPVRLYGADLSSGRRLSFQMFNPVAQSLGTVRIDAGPVESVVTRKGDRRGRLVSLTYQNIESKAWLDDKGSVIKEEGRLGGRRMVVERESEEEARGGVAEQGADIIMASRIRPIGEMPRDGQVTRLAFELRGFDSSLFPDLGGEVISSSTDTTGIVIESGPVPARVSSATDPFLRRFLSSTPAVAADNPRIRDLAGRLTVEERSDRQKARVLWEWVFANIEKGFTIGYPTAPDVLITRQGDCNEHTVLLAALCRAVGIPCKGVAGVVYRGGYFYYHAWNEVFYVDPETGSGFWLPVDATLGQWPADPTHLKFVEGDPAEQASMVALIGRLEIRILTVDGGTI